VNSQEQIFQYLGTLFPDLAENEQINVRPDIPSCPAPFFGATKM
jgi:hypothetical protein